jgi:hypothetical protein
VVGPRDTAVLNQTCRTFGGPKEGSERREGTRVGRYERSILKGKMDRRLEENEGATTMKENMVARDATSAEPSEKNGSGADTFKSGRFVKAQGCASKENEGATTMTENMVARDATSAEPSEKNGSGADTF